MPLFIYKVYPPEIKETPRASELGKEKLAAMGKMRSRERTMLAVFVLLVLLWIFGDQLAGIDSTTTAFVGLGVLLVTGVLTWKDILQEEGAWDTLVWFAALVMMASFLSELGLIPWFAKQTHGLVGGVSWNVAFPILVLISTVITCLPVKLRTLVQCMLRFCPLP